MNEHMICCELQLPYPPIRTDGKNLYYASLLTNDYAGVVSEMSTSLVYMFQHFVTAKQKISDTLKCIAQVEMRHFGLIGELIGAYGGNPRYSVQSGSKSNFWNAQNIGYETNPKLFLKENIVNEKASIVNYNIRMNQINDKHVHVLLERIILDEQNHIKVFNTLLEGLY